MITNSDRFKSLERLKKINKESLEKYLGAAQDISENTGGDITTAIEILEKSGGVGQFVDFSTPIGYEKTKSGAIKIITE